ncbi:hypothetical protein H0H81_004758 [Sphagnurus paluster]|uniref:Uncharacterized protein n=1 Tax=Sphagnurus paluster TaxID=117069 RepID=A0A9P7K740_9AGAR|nr:hypothetical protein H0H81_004758 [Sphagnurus paluster]
MNAAAEAIVLDLTGSLAETDNLIRAALAVKTEISVRQRSKLFWTWFPNGAAIPTEDVRLRDASLTGRAAGVLLAWKRGEKTAEKVIEDIAVLERAMGGSSRDVVAPSSQELVTTLPEKTMGGPISVPAPALPKEKRGQAPQRSAPSVTGAGKAKELEEEPVTAAARRKHQGRETEQSKPGKTVYVDQTVNGRRTVSIVSDLNVGAAVTMQENITGIAGSSGQAGNAGMVQDSSETEAERCAEEARMKKAEKKKAAEGLKNMAAKEAKKTANATTRSARAELNVPQPPTNYASLAVMKPGEFFPHPCGRCVKGQRDCVRLGAESWAHACAPCSGSKVKCNVSLLHPPGFFNKPTGWKRKKLVKKEELSDPETEESPKRRSSRRVTRSASRLRSVKQTQILFQESEDEEELGDPDDTITGDERVEREENERNIDDEVTGSAGEEYGKSKLNPDHVFDFGNSGQVSNTANLGLTKNSMILASVTVPKPTKKVSFALDMMSLGPDKMYLMQSDLRKQQPCPLLFQTRVLWTSEGLTRQQLVSVSWLSNKMYIKEVLVFDTELSYRADTPSVGETTDRVIRLSRAEVNAGINGLDASTFGPLVATLIVDSAAEFQHNQDEMHEMRQELQSTRDALAEMSQRLALCEASNDTAKRLIHLLTAEAKNFRERERTYTYQMASHHRRLQRIEGATIDPPFEPYPISNNTIDAVLISDDPLVVSDCNPQTMEPSEGASLGPMEKPRNVSSDHEVLDLTTESDAEADGDGDGEIVLPKNSDNPLSAKHIPPVLPTSIQDSTFFIIEGLRDYRSVSPTPPPPTPQPPNAEPPSPVTSLVPCAGQEDPIASAAIGKSLESPMKDSEGVAVERGPKRKSCSSSPVLALTAQGNVANSSREDACRVAKKPRLELVINT